MAWSDQQNQVPQNVSQGMPQNPMSPVSGASSQPGQLGQPGQVPYYATSPLQPAAAPQPAAPPNPGQYQAVPAPPMTSAGPQPPVTPTPQPPMGQVGQMPANRIPQPQQAQMNDDKMDMDDIEWVKRTKRAIASTAGDPHRKVQLIQHLRSQYLKQRFGRTVHTDEG